MYKNTNVVVFWHDGYMEEFEVDEARVGEDLLWIRLNNGSNRYIQLNGVKEIIIDMPVVDKSPDIELTFRWFYGLLETKIGCDIKHYRNSIHVRKSDRLIILPTHKMRWSSMYPESHETLRQWTQPVSKKENKTGDVNQRSHQTPLTNGPDGGPDILEEAPSMEGFRRAHEIVKLQDSRY